MPYLRRTRCDMMSIYIAVHSNRELLYVKRLTGETDAVLDCLNIIKQRGYEWSVLTKEEFEQLELEYATPE